MTSFVPITSKNSVSNNLSSNNLSSNNFPSKNSASKNSASLPFHQLEYPTQLYNIELSHHHQSLKEYRQCCNLNINNANLQLYQQQPYLTFNIRVKLIEFLLKMSIRLKILPFVFFRAVKIFDRYCSKRIILLDQSQLIITTCLWIAAKVQGGNNHFVNLNNAEKLSDIKTITDLGYGSGGKYLGPTERFRLPKLHELIKLCGNKCNYDSSMFKQMELHILNTLNWSFNDLSIEDLIVKSSEFNSNSDNEFLKIKEYLSYISLYSTELIDTDLMDLSTVIVDLINECFNMNPGHLYYQSLNIGTHGINIDDVLDDDEPIEKHEMDYNKYKFIKKNLIKAMLKSSDFILRLFNSKGPQFLYNQVLTSYESSLVTPITEPITVVTGPPNIPVPYINTNITPNSPPTPVTPDIYRPIPIKYHSHNCSTISVNSSINSSIFEVDTRRMGVYTPVSDEESPVFMK